MTMLVVMVLIAVQVGAVSAIFVRPGSEGPFDAVFLAPDYVPRVFQITGLVLAYELYVLFVVLAFPFLVVSGDVRLW